MAKVSVSRISRPTVLVMSAVLDVILVIVFAAIGRASHGEGPAGVLVTAWPFLGGLAIGWSLTRAWLHPISIVWTGIGVWVCSVGGGMLLRLVSGQGIAVAFIIVATLVLGAALIGWRLIAKLAVSLAARRSRSGA